VAEFVFWGSLAFAVYAYGLYPLLVWLMSHWARDPAADGQAADSELRPTATLLIAADRDEHAIVDRLENAAALDYPAQRLQILVGCGGDEDLTGHLARSFDKRRIEVIQFPRGGTASALNACIRQASGEILVFADARTMMRPDALRRLARHFRNPSVGGVCGKLALVDPTSGCVLERRSAKFENFLKRCEARLGALPEVNRGIYAIRKDLFVPLSEKAAVDDFRIAMQVHWQGYRLLYDESAVATTEAPLPAHEAQRRRRTQAEALHSLRLLWPPTNFRRGGISFVFCVHRALRRLCPGFLIAAFVSNACLSDDPFYLHGLLLHELFYVVALIGLFFTAEGRWLQLRQAPARSSRTIRGFFRGPSAAISGRSGKTIATESRPARTQSAP
jgi:cellulose synthase/poly-beta-1,6-N-acetylglucosamine synthase-like glycosyltransferase